MRTLYIQVVWNAGLVGGAANPKIKPLRDFPGTGPVAPWDAPCNEKTAVGCAVYFDSRSARLNPRRD